MVGHLLHPQVQHGYLLEHGCEKTHNDWFASRLTSQGVALDKFGWASVQLDGGIEGVCDKIKEHFEGDFRYPQQPVESPSAPVALRIGLLVADLPTAREALLLATLTRYIVINSGTVLVPSNSPLLRCDSYISACLFEEVPGKLVMPTLAYAQQPTAPGLHVVEVAATMSWVEVVSGLAPAVHCFVTWLGQIGERGMLSGHPFVPTIHVDVCRDDQASDQAAMSTEADITIASVDDVERALQNVLETVRSAMRGMQTKAERNSAIDFSVARGNTGVSL
jgi:hypothetical protein